MMNSISRWIATHAIALGTAVLVLILVGCAALAASNATVPKPFAGSFNALAATDPSPSAGGAPGTVTAGEAVYTSQCSSCHGANLEGVGSFPPLIGRPAVPDFPNTQVLFNYIKRSMPYNHPGSLTEDQTYSVVAYLLSKNGLLPDNTVVNAQTLPSITLPGSDRIAPPLPGAPSTPQTVTPGSSQAAPTIGP